MINKKVAYGRVLFESKTWYYHATRGWKKKTNQDRLTDGYNRIVSFLAKGK